MKLNVKVIFDDGDSSVTAINATADRIISYYLGKLFVLGEYVRTGKEVKQRAVQVEFLDKPIYQMGDSLFTLEKAYIVPEETMKEFDLHYPVRVSGWKTSEEKRIYFGFAYHPGMLSEETTMFDGFPVRTEQEAKK